jgi:hypothetical protein
MPMSVLYSAVRERVKKHRSPVLRRVRDALTRDLEGISERDLAEERRFLRLNDAFDGAEQLYLCRSDSLVDGPDGAVYSQAFDPNTVVEDLLSRKQRSSSGELPPYPRLTYACLHEVRLKIIVYDIFDVQIAKFKELTTTEDPEDLPSKEFWVSPLDEVDRCLIEACVHFNRPAADAALLVSRSANADEDGDNRLYRVEQQATAGDLELLHGNRLFVVRARA